MVAAVAQVAAVMDAAIVLVAAVTHVAAVAHVAAMVMAVANDIVDVITAVVMVFSLVTRNIILGLAGCT